MVLEETLVFGEAEDADRFVTFLKGRGVRARRRVTSFITEETRVRGPIAGLFDWLNAEIEEREEDEDLSLEAGAEPGEDIDDILGFEPDTFGEPEILSESRRLRRIRAMLARQYMVISQALETKQVGDLVVLGSPPGNQNQPGSKTMDQGQRNLLAALDISKAPDSRVDGDPVTDNGPSKAKTRPGPEMLIGGFRDLQRELDGLVARQTLVEQGIVEETAEGLRLLRTVAPDEIETEVTVTGIEISPGLVQDHGVRTDFLIHYETDYAVECEGSIHLACSADEVEEALLGTSVTPESFDGLLFDLSTKSQVIGVLLEALEREGRTTLEALVGEVQATRLETNSPEATVVVETTPEFVRALVEDLRKAGAITGNERKMRRA
ncbi:MAG TPA: hypothetical protein PK089_01805 [Methanoregulaceae archaeon]|nr:hypothetical protein [Methanoregulaceae archaeon]HQJ88522.1 hypothetical protein [Methanoregulaceae archaeon]